MQRDPLNGVIGTEQADGMLSGQLFGPGGRPLLSIGSMGSAQGRCEGATAERPCRARATALDPDFAQQPHGSHFDVGVDSKSGKGRMTAALWQVGLWHEGDQAAYSYGGFRSIFSVKLFVELSRPRPDFIEILVPTHTSSADVDWIKAELSRAGRRFKIGNTTALPRVAICAQSVPFQQPS